MLWHHHVLDEDLGSRFERGNLRFQDLFGELIAQTTEGQTEEIDGGLLCLRCEEFVFLERDTVLQLGGDRKSVV